LNFRGAPGTDRAFFSVVLKKGVTLRGWLYLPERPAGPVPTIVMAHGFSAVKEMYLDAFAEVFAQAGLGALVFDNRNFGASDGEPRQEIDPWQQVRDYRHAITYASTLPTVDATRIGIWGSSYSGGHVLVVGAIDRRVRCVVSQVPLISGHRNARRLIRADFLAPLQAQCDEDRRRRFAGEAPAMIPVVAENPLAPCVLPTADSWQWFSETGRTRAPAWRNGLDGGAPEPGRPGPHCAGSPTASLAGGRCAPIGCGPRVGPGATEPTAFCLPGASATCGCAA
jgi:dienelactone hydrolase